MTKAKNDQGPGAWRGRTRRARAGVAVAVLLLMSTGCRSGRAVGGPTAMAPEAERYLATAIDSIRATALHADSVAWPRVAAEARRAAAGARTPQEVYPAIRGVLAALGDDHSFLQLSDSLRAAERAALGAAPDVDVPAGSRRPSPYGSRMRPAFELIERDGARIGLAFMPQGRRTDAFATAFQDTLGRLARRDPCGWIVDLRGNGGGNLWPMLVGLGPLLGEGEVGRSVSPAGVERWILRDGRGIHVDPSGEEAAHARVEGEPLPPFRPRPPVAVLIDRGTASSGEALAVAFRGRPETRLFGEPTYGASTATRGVRLPDGANLVIAVSAFADVRGTVYPRGIRPDEAVAIGESILEPARDPVVSEAVRWLRSRPTCES